LAEATALISKVFSGALSDYLGKRKGLAVLGYAIGALTKPVFTLASGVGAVVAARFIDRLGKGMGTTRRAACRHHACEHSRCRLRPAPIA